MNTLLIDLRYGARMLMKKPGFTLIAVITLALSLSMRRVVRTTPVSPMPIIWTGGMKASSRTSPRLTY